MKPEHASPSISGRPGALLLHGLTGMPSEMRPVARHLVKLGCEVETPLLPGHGATHRELLRTGWKDWLAGASDSLQRLSERSDSVVVAGLSMGALLAVLLAADAETASHVSGVALLSTTLRYDGSSIPRTRRLLPLAHLLPMIENFFYWTERPPYGLRDQRLQRLIARSVAAAKRGESTSYGLFRTYVGSLRQLSLLVRQVRRRAGAVRCPALVLHSVEDTVTSVRNAREIHDLLGSQSKSISWLTGCDHVITLDLGKREVAKLIGDFTMSVARSKASPRSAVCG